MRRVTIAAACVAVTAALVAPVQAGAGTAHQTGKQSEYVVLYKEGVSAAKAREAVKKSGGTIVRENTDVGVATVRTSNSAFVSAVMRQGALQGAASNRVIGMAPKVSRSARAKFGADIEKGHTGTAGLPPAKPKAKDEPLAHLQWDNKMIHATRKGSYKVEKGDKRVRVAVLDTGIDASHPDIKANFNKKLSRNFTQDIPKDANGVEVDGPCEAEADKSCDDPATVDENDHGTHVASSIASPINKLGTSGVAPKVQLVNLRAGQDSGYFFLQPSIDALTFAGKNGIDVVNMSYYIDPWLFNCTDNPADSAADRLEQKTIAQATQRALNFAHRKGVTLVSAAGNGFTDYTKELIDSSSPDFADTPGEQPRERTIKPGDDCVSMPSGGKHVLTISSVGPTKLKAYYSDHGKGYIDLASPGGANTRNPANPKDYLNATLAAYPESLAKERGELNPDGTPKTPNIVRSCKGKVCGYYQFIQGTSMASPRAAGVAALVVSKYGRGRGAKYGLDPRVVESYLRSTATPKACPDPRTISYVYWDRQGNRFTSTQTCEGGKRFNGFYGSGIVDALRAVR